MVYALSYVRNQKALREEHNVDGIFPLLSTDINLTAKDALIAYKYQPRLEKRFTQFKGVHHAAPLLFKKIERVEAIMFLFFLALMIQAILERELRQNMKARCIDAIPIYPEHRIAYHPTTAKLFDRFEDVSVYQLRKGSNVKLFQDELTKFQKELLEMLDMKESEYWSENYV